MVDIFYFCSPMKEVKFKAWDEVEKVMLVPNQFSSFHGCDSSDGQTNRRDKIAMMTWDGLCYREGEPQRFIMLPFTGLKTSQGRVVEIYESDLLKYKDKLWKVEYWEDYAGFMLVRNAFEFGENKRIRLSCDVAFESDVLGNYYVNPEVMATEKKKFLEENNDK